MTLHVTAARTGAGRFGENSPPPWGRRSGAGKVSACAPHGGIGVERTVAYNDGNEGRAMPSPHAHFNASMPADGLYGQSHCCGGTGLQRQAIKCLHKRNDP